MQKLTNKNKKNVTLPLTQSSTAGTISPETKAKANYPPLTATNHPNKPNHLNPPIPIPPNNLKIKNNPKNPNKNKSDPSIPET